MAAAEAAAAPSRSRLVETSAGAVEYAEADDGPPLLMIHGSGGGFDQGLAMGAPLVARGWRLIATSRFGYLRSEVPPDSSHTAQADALAELLDALGIARAPVLGGSAGAMSAASFAARHPGKCAALVVLVPAIPLPGAPPMAPW